MNSPLLSPLANQLRLRHSRHSHQHSVGRNSPRVFQRSTDTAQSVPAQYAQETIGEGLCLRQAEICCGREEDCGAGGWVVAAARVPEGDHVAWREVMGGSMVVTMVVTTL
jgi:hypothetical protein